MKTNPLIETLQKELDYLDYLVTVIRKPYNRGVLTSINQKIKGIKEIIKTESRKPNATETLEEAKEMLVKFQELKQRYHAIHSKGRK